MSAATTHNISLAVLAIGLGVLSFACSGDDADDGKSAGGGGSGATSGTGASGGTSGSSATGGAGGATGGSGGSAGLGGAAAGAGGVAGASSKTGTMVPLYTDPTDATWSSAIAAKKAHPSVPMLAVINPDSGPGAAKAASYDSGSQGLKDAGIVVLGYVDTAYTANDPSTVVKPNIDKWVSWYPAISGIFFDQQSNEAGKESYYQDLDSYSKSKGLTFTIGNPGTDTAASYVGVLDMMLIYESKGVPSLSSIGGWHAQYDRKNFGIIPYGVGSLDAAYVQSAKQYVGWIYITDDDLPNPWNSLPPYFDQLVAELDK